MLSPHFAAALIARELGDPGPDGSPRFEFIVTYDRAIVERAAETLLSRVGSRAVGAVQPPLLRVPGSIVGYALARGH